MKHVNKFVLTAITTISLMLAACGEAQPTEGNAGGNADAGKPSAQSSATQSKAEDKISAKPQVQMESVTVVDNDECRITITGAQEQYGGISLKAELENKSADKTYMFAVDSADVEGLECDPLFAKTVEPAKKAVGSIDFTSDDAKRTDFTEIGMTFRVYDSDDWMADAVAKEHVAVFPYGEAAIKHYERESQASDKVLVDNDIARVTLTQIYDDSIWGYTLELYIENMSDKNLMVGIDGASIDGFMSDPFFARSVSAGNCAYGSPAWSDSQLEEIGVTTPSEIEFTIYASDNDNVSGHLFEEPVTITP